jgi:hypothetical protein
MKKWTDILSGESVFCTRCIDSKKYDTGLYNFSEKYKHCINWRIMAAAVIHLQVLLRQVSLFRQTHVRATVKVVEDVKNV